MKKLKGKKQGTLLLAIGNCGREDDGLGWKFADHFQDMNIDTVDIEYRYQLQVEDAELISDYATVIFIDATHKKLKEGFEINPCKAAGHFFYSSHMQSPEAVLYLANDLYDKFPQAYTLVIAGHEWELKTALSSKAKKNLEAAFTFFIHEFLPTIHKGVKVATPARNNKGLSEVEFK